MAQPAAAAAPSVPDSRFRRIIKKIWWLHSFGALAFGVGVMLFARAGLAFADKVLIGLFASWLLLFVALRFIVGPANRREGENVARKGVRVVTNYVIKQFYQQMFFFLVPLYASSATWSFASYNWWLAPLLLICAVLSTLDLVFDHFIMERRVLASLMYGLAMFGVLNVLVPLVFGMTHLTGLFIAAAATPIGVALLSFSVKSVFSPQGMVFTTLATGAMLGGVYLGRAAIPPAPMSLTAIAVGHGTLSSYECMPGDKHRIAPTQLDGLRCGADLTEPGGLKEAVRHEWLHRGAVVASVVPELSRCDGEAFVFRSYLPKDKVPADPTGAWTCRVMTEGGQLVGMKRFTVRAPEALIAPAPVPVAPVSPPPPATP